MGFNSSKSWKLLFIFSWYFSVVLSHSFCQTNENSLPHAHAHNDYLHPVPFYTAYNAGFGSIEADVYPVNGVLCVAHDTGNISPARNLKALYLDPLLSELQKNPIRKLKLLIDIKKNYTESLKLLAGEVEQLKKYLFTPANPNNPLTILVSGDRPLPILYKNYPDYLYFDDDLKQDHTASEWKRVGQVSLSFERFSSWKGDHKMENKERKVLRRLVNKVHKKGKTIRFWGAPDNPLSWKTQAELKVDLIGTDKIEQLSDFLKENAGLLR